MKYSIRGHNVPLTPAIENYIEEKFSKLDKYFQSPDEVEAKILLKVYQHLQRIEATIYASHYILRIDERQENLYAAIDLAVDKLERQIRKNKTRFTRRIKNATSRGEQLFTWENHDDEEDSTSRDDIVRVKQIEMIPMDSEEALLQMDLLGHDFFVYKDSDVNKICVLYKRRDGKYAIIESLD